MSESTDWGRIDDEGTVFVRTADGERAVGSWQAGTPADGLAHFVRRYDDLATEVTLLEKRLASGAADPSSTHTHAGTLAAGLSTASVVGDVAKLAARLDAIIAAADERTAELRAKRAEAKRAAVAAKETLVAEAETLSTSTQWKVAGDRLRTIVDEWKQIKGIDRRTDEGLWKRFATARDAFGKHRGTHFAELDKQRDAAKQTKETIIAEADALAESTDWAPTASRMKQLLADWKVAGRTARDTEDALWARFRAAQDRFFAARSATFSARDAEQVENQKAKEALIAEAEAIDPAQPDAAVSKLRKIAERFDEVGHVPRDAIRGLDARMRSAEDRIRSAQDDRFERSVADENPLLLQMRAAVHKAQTQLDKARAAGDERRIADAEANLAARRGWLTEAEKSVG